MKSICLLLLLPLILRAQVFQNNPRLLQPCWQGRYHSVADPFLLIDHPAALAEANSIALGVRTEKWPGTFRSGSIAAVFFYPLEEWKFSTCYDAKFGAGLTMHEAGLGVARSLGPTTLGMQLNRNWMEAIGQEMDGLVSGKLEWCWKLSPQLSLGLALHHPFGARYQRLQIEKPAMATIVNLSWSLSEKVSCSADVSKQEGQPFNINAGIQYWAEHSLLLRGGIATITAAPSLLAAWNLGDCLLGSTLNFHPTTGAFAALVFWYSPNGF